MSAAVSRRAASRWVQLVDPRLLVLVSTRAYFGTVKRGRGERCCPLLRNASRAASIAGRFSRAHLESAFNGTLQEL
jgi:hypothetical protein